MSFLQPSIPKPPPTVDAGQTDNRLMDQRRRKLQGGGRNATFAAQAATVAAPRPTLTGLGG